MYIYKIPINQKIFDLTNVFVSGCPLKTKSTNYRKLREFNIFKLKGVYKEDLRLGYEPLNSGFEKYCEISSTTSTLQGRNTKFIKLSKHTNVSIPHNFI